MLSVVCWVDNSKPAPVDCITDNFQKGNSGFAVSAKLPDSWFFFVYETCFLNLEVGQPHDKEIGRCLSQRRLRAPQPVSYTDWRQNNALSDVPPKSLRGKEL